MPTARPAFTLLEAVAVAATGAVAAAALAPALGGARHAARDEVSLGNLQRIGSATEAKASDDEGGIFNFDLGPFQQYTLPNGQVGFTTADAVANHQIQEWAVLQLVTGRFGTGGPNDIEKNDETIPHRRYRHLKLIDYLSGELPEPVVVSPHDLNQLRWAANPLDYEIGEVPSQNFFFDGRWESESLRQRWAYSTSYMSTTYAWSNDEGNLVLPSNDPLFVSAGNTGSNSPRIRVRSLAEVAFPAQKVHMFDEFDRNREQHWSYEDSEVPQLYFDGSASLNRTGDANLGWDARDAQNQDSVYRVNWYPIDAEFFPPALFDTDGDTQDDAVAMVGRFLWTRGGLQGIDYGGDEIDTTDWPD